MYICRNHVCLQLIVVDLFMVPYCTYAWVSWNNCCE